MKGLLFTFGLTYGGALVSLFNPWYGLLIYICFAIIRPEDLWHWSVPAGGNYSRIVAIGLLLGWAINGFGDWSFGKAKPIVIAFIGFFCWGIVSAFGAVADSELAFLQVEEYAKILLPFLVGITTIKTQEQVKQLAWVIVLCQGYLAYEFNLIYYTSDFFNPAGFDFGGLDRNGIAITMVTSAGMAFFLGLHVSKPWQRWLCFALAGAMTHVVLFSLSRGGMVAIIVTGAVTFLLIPKQPKTMALFALALVVGLSLAGEQVVERFQTTFADDEERDYSAESRLDLWKACATEMIENPIAGVGLRNWKLIAHHHGFKEGKDSHTMWLNVGAEMGMIGLGWLVAFYGYCMARLWPIARAHANHTEVDDWAECVAQMVIAAFAGFAVSAQFVSVHGVELPFYIVLTGAGALKLRSLQAASADALNSLGDADEVSAYACPTA